ncbi:MAG: hypothetical protein FJW39_09955 [Acidobacteria bacterium]|nr:hypothetical protein [Acidobacteriota bacterium]
MALLLAVCTPLQAGIINTYTSRATWEAATSGRTDITFNVLGLAAGGFTSYSNSTGLTVAGVTFTGFNETTASYFLYGINPAIGWDENWGTGTLIKGPTWYQSAGVTTSYIQLVMPASVTSFGIDLMTIGPRGANVRLSVDGTDLGSPVSTSTVSPTFVGFTSDTPVNQIRISIGSGTLFNTQALIDNVAFGTVSGGGGGGGGGGVETPETTTLLLVGSGLYVCALKKRRWRRPRPALP